jgi:hypothetical protein
VVQRHQWRALAAILHIVATKIRDDGNVKRGRHARRIANLHGDALGRCVANGLPMKANEGNGFT